MKLNFRDFLRKCQFPVMLAAGSMPLPMFVCAQVIPDKLGACLLMAAAYIFAAWICTVTPGKARIPAGILLSAGLLALSYFILPLLTGVSVCLIPTMYILLLLGGLRIGGWAPDQELHPMVGSVSLVAHMIAQFFVNVDRQNNAGAVYEPVAPMLTISFLIFGALWMAALNRASLVSADNGRGRVPKSMKIKNRLLTAAMMAAVLLIAAIPAVIRAVGRAWEWIKAFLLMVLRFILSLLPEQSGGSGGGGGGMDMSMFGEASTEQSLLSLILQYLMMIVGGIIALILIGLALRVVWRNLKILYKRMMARLNEYMASSSEDYVDEISDTREDGQHERSRQRGLRRMLKKRVDESTLSPRERVRYRYLMMWLKHPEWTPERTARENLTGDAAQLYERARYSSHEISEQEANTFAQYSDRRKG